MAKGIIKRPMTTTSAVIFAKQKAKQGYSGFHITNMLIRFGFGGPNREWAERVAKKATIGKNYFEGI